MPPRSTPHSVRIARALVFAAVAGTGCASAVDPTACPESPSAGDLMPCSHEGFVCNYDGGCLPNCSCDRESDGGLTWHCGIRCGGPLPPPELDAMV